MNNMLDRDRISVVLTTYNGERFIREQLDSILDQTLKPDEIIIVDDCSTDNTYEILLSYAMNYGMVKVFRNDYNIGAHQNFRKAFGLSTCPLIAPSDQDDIWNKEKLEVLHEILVTQDVDLVYSKEMILWENGTKSFDSHEMPSLNDFIWGNCLKGHTFLFRRKLLKVFEDVKKLSFDYALAIRAGVIGSYASSNEALSVWRHHKGVMTTAVSDNSELVIRDVPRREKLKYAFRNLKKEKSMPIKESFSDRAIAFRGAEFHKMHTGKKGRDGVLSVICANVAKRTRWSMFYASFLNMLAQPHQKGLRNKVAHAMWAFRQPWIYWYDMHKLRSLE